MKLNAIYREREEGGGGGQVNEIVVLVTSNAPTKVAWRHPKELEEEEILAFRVNNLLGEGLSE